MWTYQLLDTRDKTPLKMCDIGAIGCQQECDCCAQRGNN